MQKARSNSAKLPLVLNLLSVKLPGPNLPTLPGLPGRCSLPSSLSEFPTTSSGSMSKEMRHGMMRTLATPTSAALVGFTDSICQEENTICIETYLSRFFKLVYAKPFNMMHKTTTE